MSRYLDIYKVRAVDPGHRNYLLSAPDIFAISQISRDICIKVTYLLF